MEFKRDLGEDEAEAALLWKQAFGPMLYQRYSAERSRDPYIEQKPTEPDALRGWYNDAEWILKRNIERFEKTYFAGDALPCIFPYFGTGGHAKYIVLEEQTVYEPDTIWINPIEEEFPDYDFRLILRQIPCSKESCQSFATWRKEGEGRFLSDRRITVGVMMCSQLRGPENLLIDLIEAGQEVKHAAAQMMSILKCSASIFFPQSKKTIWAVLSMAG